MDMPMRKIVYKLALTLILIVGSTLILSACSDNNTIDAFPTIAPNPSAAKLPESTPGPVPGARVEFPLDEAPHNDITEWWYYTGHLNTAKGGKYGFEFVIFQGNQADFPTGYAAHFAITNSGSNLDNMSSTYDLPSSVGFSFDQRADVITAPKLGGNNGFNLAVKDWTLQGLNGNDHIKAKMSNSKYAIDLNLKDSQGIALHGGGEISYGVIAASYYYSRPFMDLTGTLSIDGQPEQVTGQAWFDHQWGNFTSFGGSGWDWFSTRLDDGTALMFYQLRNKDNTFTQILGSYILPCTSDCNPSKPLKVVELDQKDFSINPTQSWRNQGNNISYPIGWRFSMAANAQKGLPELNLTYKAALPNQELDTRASTNTIYWEGENVIAGTKNGKLVKGLGYVELTGYDSNK